MTDPPTPFQLTDSDKAQPLWHRLKTYLEQRLDTARKRNDAPLTEAETATLRGEIRCLRQLIMLGDDRPMTGEDDEAP